jgi:hypothetical protein
MRTMRDGGAALRAIAEQITADGVKISHVGVKRPWLRQSVRPHNQRNGPSYRSAR